MTIKHKNFEWNFANIVALITIMPLLLVGGKWCVYMSSLPTDVRAIKDQVQQMDSDMKELRRDMDIVKKAMPQLYGDNTTPGTRFSIEWPGTNYLIEANSHGL